jgi:hypothetical protein
MDENHCEWSKRLECRIEAVEGDMVVMKTDLAVIRNNYCTKEDLVHLETRMTANMAELERRLVRWFVGTAVTFVVAAISVTRLLA